MNKKLLLSILFCFICYGLFSQYRVGISYILSDITTKNISIFGQYDVNKKHQIGLGIKYHFNDDSTIILSRYSRFFYRNLYAQKLINKIGLTLEYKYWFYNSQWLKPYLFYNAQYIRIGSKFFSDNSITDLQTGITTKENKQVTFDPINFFENHIGLGIDISLNKEIRIFAGISAGITFLSGLYTIEDLNTKKSNYAFSKSGYYEFSWLFNTGFSYSLGDKKKKRKKHVKVSHNTSSFIPARPLSTCWHYIYKSYTYLQIYPAGIVCHSEKLTILNQRTGCS